MPQRETIGIVANIAWAYNRWKGFDEEGSEKRRRYGFEYVRQTGVAHEWWNFYEDFDPKYYYGHVESRGKLSRFSNGDVVIFVSRNVEDGNFYFVGFYGNAEYSEGGFKTGKTLRDLLPEEFQTKLRELSETGELSGRHVESLKTALFENPEEVKRKFKAEKTLSAVFLPEAYVKFSPKEIGLKRFGQNKVVYVGKNETVKPECIQKLILKAKQQHEALLNDPEISDEKKQNAKRIIEKIEGVLKEYFGGVDMNNEILRQYFQSNGYYFPDYLVSQFYTALKTKGFVILSGLTGTGKTKIAQELAELLDGSKNNLLFLSVRPDWRDSKALLGYYNPLTGEYHKTSLLEFILRAKEDYEQNREKAMPYFIILDEMNLAHVEYYFADFLSVFESGRDNDGFTKESIKLHDNEEVEIFQGIPKELKLPPNLYIIGTVNMDETTYSFSPKVLDRAFVVEFHDVELEEYPPERINLSEEEVGKLRNAVLDDLRRDGRFLAVRKKGKDESEEGDIEKALNELKDANNGKYWEILKQLNKALEPYDMHFGYRVVDEIALFFQSAKESQDRGIVEFTDDDEIFDLALLMKVLPKFHGNRKKLEEPLKAVLELCRSENAEINIQELGRDKVIELLKNWETQKENFRFKHTARKVLRMLRQLYEIGFASFS